MKSLGRSTAGQQEAQTNTHHGPTLECCACASLYWTCVCVHALPLTGCGESGQHSVEQWASGVEQCCGWFSKEGYSPTANWFPMFASSGPPFPLPSSWDHTLLQKLLCPFKKRTTMIKMVAQTELLGIVGGRLSISGSTLYSILSSHHCSSRDILGISSLLPNMNMKGSSLPSRFEDIKV